MENKSISLAIPASLLIIASVTEMPGYTKIFLLTVAFTSLGRAILSFAKQKCAGKQ